MTRKLWISLFLLPMVRSATAWLRNKDENSTGFDDAAADAADRFITALEEYLASE